MLKTWLEQWRQRDSDPDGDHSETKSETEKDAHMDSVVEEEETGELNELKAAEITSSVSDVEGYDMKRGKNSVSAGSHSPQHRILTTNGCDYDLGAPYHNGGSRGDRGCGRFEGQHLQFPHGKMRGGKPPNERGFSRPGYAPGYDIQGGKNSVCAGSRSPSHWVPEPSDCEYDLDPPHHGGKFMGGRDGSGFEGQHPQFPLGSIRPTTSYRKGFFGRNYGRAERFHPEGQILKRNRNSLTRGGDWVCLDATCRYMNLARRKQCSNCNKPQKGMAQNFTLQEGAWICSESTCGYFNFPMRKKCNKCSKPRKEMASFGNEAGGAVGGLQGPKTPSPFMGGPSMGRGAGQGQTEIGISHGGQGRGSPGASDQMSLPRQRERSPPVRSVHLCHGDYNRNSYVDRLRDDRRDKRENTNHDGCKTLISSSSWHVA